MDKPEKLPNTVTENLQGFKLRKKRVSRKLQYEKWYAYKRIENKLHWIYLGNSSEGAQGKIESYLARLAIERKKPPFELLASKRKELMQSLAKAIETAKETHVLLDTFIPDLENPALFMESRFAKIEKACLQIEALAKA